MWKFFKYKIKMIVFILVLIVNVSSCRYLDIEDVGISEYLDEEINNAREKKKNAMVDTYRKIRAITNYDDRKFGDGEINVERIRESVEDSYTWVEKENSAFYFKNDYSTDSRDMSYFELLDYYVEGNESIVIYAFYTRIKNKLDEYVFEIGKFKVASRRYQALYSKRDNGHKRFIVKTVNIYLPDKVFVIFEDYYFCIVNRNGEILSDCEMQEVVELAMENYDGYCEEHHISDGRDRLDLSNYEIKDFVIDKFGNIFLQFNVLRHDDRGWGEGFQNASKENNILNEEVIHSTWSMVQNIYKETEERDITDEDLREIGIEEKDFGENSILLSCINVTKQEIFLEQHISIEWIIPLLLGRSVERYSYSFLEVEHDELENLHSDTIDAIEISDVVLYDEYYDICLQDYKRDIYSLFMTREVSIWDVNDNNSLFADCPRNNLILIQDMDGNILQSDSYGFSWYNTDYENNKIHFSLSLGLGDLREEVYEDYGTRFKMNDYSGIVNKELDFEIDDLNDYKYIVDCNRGVILIFVNKEGVIKAQVIGSDESIKETRIDLRALFGSDDSGVSNAYTLRDYMSASKSNKYIDIDCSGITSVDGDYDKVLLSSPLMGVMLYDKGQDRLYQVTKSAAYKSYMIDDNNYSCIGLKDGSQTFGNTRIYGLECFNVEEAEMYLCTAKECMAKYNVYIRENLYTIDIIRFLLDKVGGGEEYWIEYINEFNDAVNNYKRAIEELYRLLGDDDRNIEKDLFYKIFEEGKTVIMAEEVFIDIYCKVHERETELYNMSMEEKKLEIANRIITGDNMKSFEFNELFNEVVQDRIAINRFLR